MDVNSRYQELIEPSEALIAEIAKLEGDLIILGAGGKMGPDLCRLARRAINIAGSAKEVVAVARFSESGLQQTLKDHGIKTIAADLMEEDELQSLPAIQNVLYLAGTKFGTTGKRNSGASGGICTIMSGARKDLPIFLCKK